MNRDGLRRLLRVLPLVLAVGVTVAACGDHEFHPPSEEAQEARADSVYDPVIFDTLTWSSTSARIQQGNLVFADQCRRCHGPLGRGGTDYARVNELQVPSLVERDWPMAGRIDSVRYEIFVGHGKGMPNWGVGRLSPRQIDAAAFYILHQLRPDVLQDSARIPGD